jgi:AAA+ superfamily predicted ATPase
MIPAATVDWQEANQRHLMAAVWEVRSKLARLVGQDAGPQPEDPPDFEGLPKPAIDRLAEAFGLTDFERNIVLLCAGVELDSRFNRLLSQNKAVSGSGQPIFGLALSLFEDAHWSALTPSRPLRRWRLIEVGAGETLTASPLRIAERVLHYLAGASAFDESLRASVSIVPSAAELSATHQQICDRLVAIWENQDAGGRAPLVELRGSDPEAIRQVASAAASAMGLQLYSIPARNAPASAADLSLFASLWCREAVLSSCGLLVEFGDAEGVEAANAAAMLEALSGLVIVSTASPRRSLHRTSVVVAVDRPSAAEQVKIWHGVLEPWVSHPDAIATKLTAHFDLGGSAIAAAAAQVLAGKPPEDASIEDALWMACREQARARLDRVAERIESPATWDDLVLAESQREILRQIEVHVARRATVYQEWGFAAKGSRGLGISALFAGPSGTGKTLASEVLANELRLDLYRVDLSQVVSKYIGETEKNLARVFDAAEESAAVLLFDEADALFGRRTEVKDSHDRYANIEVSYLLQRMEAYRGLAVLTTNRKRALDQAFLRRIRFVVEFPFPDFAQRAELWRRVFPSKTPTRNLQVDALARLHAAGGNIKNIAVSAAFLAADAGEPVSMKHLLAATRSEFAKIETPLTELEVAGWHES